MAHEFTEYKPLAEALEILKRSARPSFKRQLVHVADSCGRVLFEDIVSRADVPSADSSHMDGFAVRSADVPSSTSSESPVALRLVTGARLGEVPRSVVRRGEAHSVLTGGYLPRGADAVVPSERARVANGKVLITTPVSRGDYVFPRGRDIKKGELVLKKGRVMRATDTVLAATLRMDRVPVYRTPIVAVIPTGDELTTEIRSTEKGKVVETHSMLLSRLIEGAGGEPLTLPIARDELGAITARIRQALDAADIVLTLAGSSVGEPDLIERAIGSAGDPGVLVHGIQVFRGRVMGFGVLRGRPIVILPGPIQGAVNAFALMAYPLIRSFLGRGFEQPPSVPARVSLEWRAGERYRHFTKVVYVRVSSRGDEILAEPSGGETEKITHLTRNDGYVIVEGDRFTLKKNELVRVHLLPGLSPFPFVGELFR